jgi:riboflavin-specific deaminase-like protein
MTCGIDAAWGAVLAAARDAERVAACGVPVTCAFGDGQLWPVAPDDPSAIVGWRPGAGWEPRLPQQDSGHVVLDLYLPLCGATAAAPVTVGHLGQSLDGFIATLSGDSEFVTGHENIVHLHRLRALCDAVIVGAGTVAADDPQLTTRLVQGPNPLRVIFDPARRLDGRNRVFNDDAGETLYICARAATQPGETHLGRAAIVGIDDTTEGTGVADVQRQLRARGCTRILVEGGGVTVSAFLKAHLLDRLQVTVAPFILGAGRPGIRLPAPALLRDCERPRSRVFPMGRDVLFELLLRES